MNRVLILLYGAVCYVLFFGAFLYMIGFMANAGVPKGVDGPAPASLAGAIAVDLGLILLFGLQHSVMARAGFKRWWTRVVPHAVERSTYVLATSVVLILLYWLWQPIPTMVWQVHGTVWRGLSWASYASGIATILLSTFMVDHFDLFGLRQVWFAFTQRLYEYPGFTVRWFYRFVRHPLYSGFFVAFWSTPDMSVGHVIFSAGMTAYVLIAVRFEERDLLRTLGPDYAQYQRAVPMFMPKAGQVPAPTSSSQKAPSGMR